MELPDERAARNNAVFREANEGIKASAAQYGMTSRIPFICECPDSSCTTIVQLSLSEYEEIRSEARRFLVATGHESVPPHRIRVVRSGDDYEVVEKLGTAGEVAEELDPRRDDAAAAHSRHRRVRLEPMDEDREQAEERGRRIGLNEAVFREFNERLRAVAADLDLELLDLVCECGDADCTERIAMSVQEYEELRSDPRRFAVVPGHELAGFEEILERRGAYDVICKRAGAPAELARETDPRSS